MEDEKIEIKKEIYYYVINELKMLQSTTLDCNSKIIAEKILNMLDNSQHTMFSLKQRIEEKVRETKNTNPNLNAFLYILLRKVENGQISEIEAADIFEGTMAEEQFGKIL